MKKVKETDIKLHLHNDEVYVEYDCVMQLVKRHDELVDRLNERNN